MGVSDRFKVAVAQEARGARGVSVYLGQDL
jgi:hypothetical protein